MSKIVYYIIVYAFLCISKLPDRIHYFNSAIISWVLYYIVRYRRNIVEKNIRDSFPMKPDAEIRKLVRDFYQHLGNICVESVMYFGFSEDNVRQRMLFERIDMVRQDLLEGKSVAIYLGHYANWEWAASISLHLVNIGLVAQLYHPLENKIFDKIIGESRERFGGINIPVEKSIRQIMQLLHGNKPIVVGFIADQVPHWRNIHLWLPFLNHPDTPVFTGAERIARKCGMSAYYLDVKKIKQGYYAGELKLMTENVQELPDNRLTEIYTNMLEETILREPSLWLWSHNRWKRTRQEWENMKLKGELR